VPPVDVESPDGSTDGGTTPSGTTVTFLGSSYKPSADTKGAIDIQPPSGAREGDLVLALRNVGWYNASPLPAGWSVLGEGAAGVASSLVSYPSISYHVLGAGESDATHFAFTHAGAGAVQELALVAFRGPRKEHPIGQSAVAPSLNPEPGGSAPYALTHKFPSIEPVAGKFVVAVVITAAETAFPDLQGLKSVAISPGIGFYRSEAPLATAAFQAPSMTLSSDRPEIRNAVAGAIALDD
jgi:hypothetical protein